MARNVSSLWMRHKESIAFHSVIGDKAWKPDYNFAVPGKHDYQYIQNIISIKFSFGGYSSVNLT